MIDIIIIFLLAPQDAFSSFGLQTVKLIGQTFKRQSWSRFGVEKVSTWNFLGFRTEPTCQSSQIDGASDLSLAKNRILQLLKWESYVFRGTTCLLEL